MRRSITLISSAFFLLCAGARADTIKVSSGLAIDLQSAITAALPGDLISVSGGPYEGNFTIPANKNGLTLKGKVLIHAQNGANGFLVESSGVTLSGLTIRQALDDGIAGPTAGTLAGISIEKCVFVDCGGAAVFVRADDAILSGCVAEGCNGGFTVIGDDASATKCEVFNTGVDGFDFQGTGGRVTKCEVSVAVAKGIFVSGGGAIVSGNKIRDVGETGIFAEGVGGSVTMTGNTVDNAAQGIVVQGDGSEISKNTVHGTGNCFDLTGVNLVISKNSAMGSRGTGFSISSSSGGSLIEGNTAEFTTQDGFDMTVSNATILKNKATRCGGLDDAGYNVFGTGNMIEANTAESCDDSGFLIRKNDNTLTKNKAVNCGNNGFLVDGSSPPTGVILDGNTATGNGGEGIHNAGTGTILRNNKCSKNQLDVGNETGAGATIIDGGSNKVGTGGDFITEPEIPN